MTLDEKLNALIASEWNFEITHVYEKFDDEFKYLCSIRRRETQLPAHYTTAETIEEAVGNLTEMAKTKEAAYES